MLAFLSLFNVFWVKFGKNGDFVVKTRCGIFPLGIGIAILLVDWIEFSV